MSGTWIGRKVLVTGGMGFIGSTLAHRLVGAGAVVTLVDSLIPEYGGNPFNIAGIEDRVRVNVSDVRDPHSMRHLIQGQDVLFNLAGQASHLDSMEDPFTDLEINSRAQVSILEACRRHNPTVRLVFASTRQIYGRPQYLPVDEKHLLRPVDVNGVNKVAGESYHLVYHDAYGLRASSLRLTNTIGPRMRVKDARQTFLGVWVRLLLEGRPFEVWGGDQRRDFTYVDDVVDALLLAADSERANGSFFNLGGREVVTLRELAEMLVEVNGGGTFAMRDFPAERKQIDIGDYYADWTLIRDTLGWAPAVPLREALTRTLDYYRAHLARYL
jgi:UDP-glucose 4-epimerase